MTEFSDSYGTAEAVPLQIRKTQASFCDLCVDVAYASRPSPVGGPKPHLARMASRNFSRSSGVMRLPQRSPLRWREPCHPRPLTPPNRMRQSTSIAIACQKVIRCQPKRPGSIQFHRLMTTHPPKAMNNTMPIIAAGTMKNSFFPLIFLSSCFRKLVVNRLQSLAQMQHCISLAREQRIHAHAAFGGHLFEAAPFDL